MPRLDLSGDAVPVAINRRRKRARPCPRCGDCLTVEPNLIDIWRRCGFELAIGPEIDDRSARGYVESDQSHFWGHYVP